METRDLESWSEFRPTLADIRETYGVCDRGEYSERNTLLFRGVASSDWPLSTTLERASEERWSVELYMLAASKASFQIQSFTGRDWGLPDFDDIAAEIREQQKSFYPHLPHYDYLIYLRHHGFPSPLLDWTTSPYVAAYFAYAEAPGAERVALYFYVEAPHGGKSWSGNPPLIHERGPYVTTHSRHFAQKALYTVCTQWDKDDERHYFKPHSLVFDEGNERQDVLIKMTLPSSDRAEALRELSDYNIDHFTLFQTEDALVKALAINAFVLD